MSEIDERIMTTFAEALPVLTEREKENLMFFAEGVRLKVEYLDKKEEQKQGA